MVMIFKKTAISDDSYKFALVFSGLESYTASTLPIMVETARDLTPPWIRQRPIRR
jgi:hypothetical protein